MHLELLHFENCPNWKTADAPARRSLTGWCLDSPGHRRS